MFLQENLLIFKNPSKTKNIQYPNFYYYVSRASSILFLRVYHQSSSIFRLIENRIDVSISLPDIRICRNCWSKPFIHRNKLIRLHNCFSLSNICEANTNFVCPSVSFDLKPLVLLFSYKRKATFSPFLKKLCIIFSYCFIKDKKMKILYHRSSALYWTQTVMIKYMIMENKRYIKSLWQISF